MKSTELFVEQTLTGFLVLSAAAAPFVSLESLQAVSDEAKGGIDIGSAAGAIGAAYLLGVIFDRFADTLLERFNRWNRLLFAIELKKDNKALFPEDPFPEDQLQIEVIQQGAEAWAWMDYLRSRIRIARAMTAFVPALTISLALAAGFRDRPDVIHTVLALVVAVYVSAFLASRILEKSSRRLPKTYHLHTDEDFAHARDGMRTMREPAFWLGVVLTMLALGLIVLGNGPDRAAMAGLLATGGVLSGISAWVWWRTTVTFMQFLRDFRKWGREKPTAKA
jgi:hypothetical protein